MPQPRAALKRTRSPRSKASLTDRIKELTRERNSAAAMAEAFKRKLDEVFTMREMAAELGVAHEKLEQIRVACRSKLGLKKRVLEILTAGTDFDPSKFAELPSADEGGGDDDE